MLSFSVNQFTITKLSDPSPASHNIDHLTASFTFSDDWTEQPFAIFKGSGACIKQMIVDGQCIVPWEVLQTPGYVYVSCFAGQRITSNIAQFYVNASGYCDADNEHEPTPEVYDQIIAYFDSIKADVLAAASSASQSAASASESATAAAESAGEASDALTGVKAACADVTEKIGQAQNLVTQATAAADSAIASAATATTQAGLATQAAQAATQAKTDAETAAANAADSESAAEEAAESARRYYESISFEESASGQVATFDDGADNVPMPSVVVNMSPSQSATPWVSDTADTTPYIKREYTGQGNAEFLDKIVGGSVVRNQLVQNDSTKFQRNNVSVSVTNNSLVFTSTKNTSDVKRASVFVSPNEARLTPNHVYLGSGIVKSEINIDHNLFPALGFFAISEANIKSVKCPYNETVNISVMYKVGDWSTSSTATRFGIRIQNNATDADGSVSVENMELIDLTQMFGSAIADYAYTLERATAGSGVAWLKSYGFFADNYYPYNPGSMEHVSGFVSHDVVGFNQWNEEWEVGVYNTDTGAKLDAPNQIRCKNPIPVIPNTLYFAKKISWAGFFDSDGTIIPTPNVGIENVARARNMVLIGDRIFTTPQNATGMIFYNLGNYGATYKHDICINLSDPARNGKYEPYQKHSYPLDSALTLRGIPKLSADNQLYYDGDEYAADGTVTRRYSIRAYQSGDESLTDAITDGTNTVYKLATPTTEQATPYTSPQTLISGGTEEFVTDSIPVGHSTRFAGIYPIEGRTGVTVYVSPTTDSAGGTTYTVSWQSEAGTVYGGTVDIVSGILTVTTAEIPSYNGETITAPWWSSYDEYVAGATPTTGAQVVYTLATPVTIQLTPQEVDSLLGVNNVWSDAGDMSVTYQADLKLYIDKKIQEAIDG